MSDFAIFGVSADAQQVKGLYEAGGSGVNGIRWMFVWEKNRMFVWDFTREGNGKYGISLGKMGK
jgi:hypothetical protein